MSDVLTSYELHPLRSLAVAIKRGWADGTQTPDARAAFGLHPELLSVKTIFLDLAYEEYCQRRQRGEAADPDEFCAGFPRYRSALRRLIETHRYMSEHAGLLAGRPDPWPSAGEMVAGFAIRRELGRGAFARVYLATEATAGDRPVALKLTFEGGAEACILGRLSHPNIVHVNSADEDEGTGLTCLCMPYLGSATLQTLLRRAFPRAGAAPPARAAIILETVAASVDAGDPAPDVAAGAANLAEVLRAGTYADGVAEIGRQLAGALAFVHRAGVFHSDLKPTNVLLAPGGRPVLLDFNLSNDGRLGAARLGGTLAYMAPEQVDAILQRDLVSPELSGRADVFSLGVLLYELLTGRLPFGPLAPNATAEEGGPILRDAHRVGFRPVRALVPAVPTRLARLVERCLALRPVDRLDAAELARALTTYLGRTPRLRRWVYAGCAAGLLTCVIGAEMWWSRHGTQRPTPSVNADVLDDLESPDALFKQGRQYMRAGNYEAAIVFLDKAVKQRAAVALPPDGQTMACRSCCQAHLGYNKPAWENAEAARQAGYINAAVFNNEGIAYHNDNRDGKAYRCFSDAIRLDNELWQPHVNRGNLYLSRPSGIAAERDAARMDFATAVRLGGPRVELKYKLGLLAAEAGEHDEAVKYFAEAERGEIPRDLLVAAQRQYPSLRGISDFTDILRRAKANPHFKWSDSIIDLAVDTDD
jgi:serine/threonine protein kinase